MDGKASKKTRSNKATDFDVDRVIQQTHLDNLQQTCDNLTDDEISQLLEQVEELIQNADGEGSQSHQSSSSSSSSSASSKQLKRTMSDLQEDTVTGTNSLKEDSGRIFTDVVLVDGSSNIPRQDGDDSNSSQGDGTNTLQEDGVHLEPPTKKKRKNWQDWKDQMVSILEKRSEDPNFKIKKHTKPPAKQRPYTVEKFELH